MPLQNGSVIIMRQTRLKAIINLLVILRDILKDVYTNGIDYVYWDSISHFCTRLGAFVDVDIFDWDEYTTIMDLINEQEFYGLVLYLYDMEG